MPDENWAKESSADLGVAKRIGRRKTAQYQEWMEGVGFSEENLHPDLDSSLSMQVARQLQVSSNANPNLQQIEKIVKNFLHRQGANTLTDLQSETILKLRAADTFDDYVTIMMKTDTASGISLKKYFEFYKGLNLYQSIEISKRKKRDIESFLLI